MFTGCPSVTVSVRASGLASCQHDNSRTGSMISTKFYADIL